MRDFPQLGTTGFVPTILIIASFLLTPVWAFAQRPVFGEEVIEKWKKYEFFSRSLQGTARGSGTLPNGKPRHFLYHYKQNRQCACFNKPGDEPSLDEWFISNPLYSAQINKNKENPNHVSLLSYDKNENAPFFGKRISVSGEIFLETSPHFSCGWYRLSELAVKPEFNAKNVGKESYNGRDLVRVDYIFDEVDPRNSSWHKKSHGSIYFDPERNWCISRIKRITQTIIRGEVKLEEEADNCHETIDHPSGFPLIKRRIHSAKRLNFRNHNPPQKTIAESTIDYEWEVNENVPDAEFTLSAFGLPELGSAHSKKKSPIYIRIFLSAASCALLALAFRYLARRRRNRSASAS